MSKWKNIKTYMEVNPYTGQPIDEDMPTNAAGRGAVAGIGVGPDGEPGYDPKKKKRKRTLIDARSKSYRQHRARLEKARAKREEKKSKLAQKVAEDTLNFEREKFIEEDNSEQIKKLEKMLKDLERQKKKTPGGGFAKMKIKQLIADLKSKKEEVELDEVRISDYVVDTLRDIKRSKSSRNLKLKGGDIKIDMDTANKMLDFLDHMANPMSKKKIMDILDKGTKTDFMKVNQAVTKAIK